jgi:predicted Zn-dependent peptidase
MLPRLWMVPLIAGFTFSSRASAVDAPIVFGKTDPAKAALERLSSSIQRFTLANGLRVVLAPDHTASTVAVSVTYGVGSSSEIEGRTGFAHLFEHLMFQGSKHAEKGAHFRLISARGGTLNGTTDSDRTNYYEVLPAPASSAAPPVPFPSIA